MPAMARTRRPRRRVMRYAMPADPARATPSAVSVASRMLLSCWRMPDRGSATVERVPTIIEPTYSLGLVGAVEVGSG